MAKLKLLSTIFSKLASLTKNNGQIIATRDSKSLYIDLEGERIEITDWVDVDTEESLLVILSPLINKYYYTKDTNKIWRYISGEWKCLNASVNDLTPTYAESSTLVKLSSGEKLSVAFGKISKAITDLISHIGDSIKHITSAERTNWNAAKTHADSTHAPTNAQANVIETVKVNGTALTPSSKAVNVTVPTKVSQLTNDSGFTSTKVEKSSTNGNIKINGTETTVYTHPSGTNPHGTTKNDVGLGNVGNFKAVSTVASQGLTDTEKSNARANIGAGTSSFSGSYNDLTNKPTIPTVGNGTVTIKQAGTSKGTFTMNQSGNTTIELTDNNTTYGVATSSALGLIKSGTDITIDSNGNVSVNDDSHNHVISNVDGLQSALDGKSATGHTHDDRYYTESEIDSKLSGKADSSHTHSYLPLSGGQMTDSIITPKNDNMGIIPNTNNYGQIGSSDKKFYRMYATTFYGALSGNASTATALTTSAGSATQPVYFSGGKPIACTYTLGKSVPSNAVFTDTWRGIQNNLTSNSTTDSLSAAQGKVLKDEISDVGYYKDDYSCSYLSGGAIGKAEVISSVKNTQVLQGHETVLTGIASDIASHTASINTLNSNLSEINKFTPKGAINNLISDCLNITVDLNFNYIDYNGYVASEGSDIYNSPVNGTFYAYREIKKIPNINQDGSSRYGCKIIVILYEAYPQPCRIWLNVYNTDTQSWNGWVEK